MALSHFGHRFDDATNIIAVGGAGALQGFEFLLNVFLGDNRLFAVLEFRRDWRLKVERESVDVVGPETRQVLQLFERKIESIGCQCILTSSIPRCLSAVIDAGP